MNNLYYKNIIKTVLRERGFYSLVDTKSSDETFTAIFPVQIIPDIVNNLKLVLDKIDWLNNNNNKTPDNKSRVISVYCHICEYDTNILKCILGSPNYPILCEIG